MALTNRTLIIFKYLWETTDESHPVSLADISAFLKLHEIAADPRTLRKDMDYPYYYKHPTLIVKKKGGSDQTRGQLTAMLSVMRFGMPWERTLQVNPI